MTIVSRTMAHAGADGRSDRRRVGGAVGRAGRGARRERHRHHRHRRGGADSHQGAHRGGDAAAAQPAAVHHRHRRAARRRAGGRRDRAGVPLQHRRPAGDRAARTWRGATSEIARAEAIVAEEVEKFGAWLRSRGAIPTVVALRQRFEAIRRAELQRLEFKLVGAAAGGARARRRGHAAHRREAAADADRAAEGARRHRNGRRVHRGADPAVRAATTAAPSAPGEAEPERPAGRVEPFARSQGARPR